LREGRDVCAILRSFAWIVSHTGQRFDPGDVSALLIPPAACKPAEEDESHQSDDETDPEAPKDQQKDPDQDDDPTEGEPAPRTEATLPCSHAFLLISC
jgi:hypothetical protein